ncbi:hypothetical protein, partial [Staphylococcus saprophyticus]|uniref:hypothetical protein n=1 Tax=Staphylococcus saprophyticus TaxID=29385 RepID=UPI001C930F6F
AGHLESNLETLGNSHDKSPVLLVTYGPVRAHLTFCIQTATELKVVPNVTHSLLRYVNNNLSDVLCTAGHLNLILSVFSYC